MGGRNDALSCKKQYQIPCFMTRCTFFCNYGSRQTGPIVLIINERQLKPEQ